jgi:hypothetical protein
MPVSILHVLERVSMQATLSTTASTASRMRHEVVDICRVYSLATPPVCTIVHPRLNYVIFWSPKLNGGIVMCVSLSTQLACTPTIRPQPADSTRGAVQMCTLVMRHRQFLTRETSGHGSHFFASCTSTARTERYKYPRLKRLSAPCPP